MALMSDGLLQLKRLPSRWQDRVRAYKVLVDGAEIGRLANGATGSYRVAPGEHRLRLKIDWAGSQEEHFSVGADEVVKFECRAQFGSIPFVGLIVLLVRPQKWVLLQRVE
jgi:hypothetical protein